MAGHSESPPQLLDLVKRSAEYLTAHGIDNGRREAEWIFAESLHLSRLDLYTRFDMPLDPAEVTRLRALITRRGRREPLAYILGNHEFHGLRLTVGPGVLVPRPETEELIEHVVLEIPNESSRLLDVGTGSGAIALALKQARSDCLVEATDISLEALSCARVNATALNLEILFHLGHLAESVQGVFAVIVANLPYIGTSERAECDPELAFEPQQALFSGESGLDLISALIADAPRILSPQGILWLEHGWRQGEAVRALAAQQDFEARTLLDSAGKERFARISRRA